MRVVFFLCMLLHAGAERYISCKLSCDIHIYFDIYGVCVVLFLSCVCFLQADAELRLYCAFSFPAVVITIGPDRWHELRESFALLIRDPSWSVRKTLSFSLHEVRDEPEAGRQAGRHTDIQTYRHTDMRRGEEEPVLHYCKDDSRRSRTNKAHDR